MILRQKRKKMVRLYNPTLAGKRPEASYSAIYQKLKTKQNESKSAVRLTTPFRRQATTSGKARTIIDNYAEKRQKKGCIYTFLTPIRAFADRKQTTCRQKTVLPTTRNIRFAEGKHTTCRGKSDAFPPPKHGKGPVRECPRSLSTVNISIHHCPSAEYRKSFARMETDRPPAGKKRFSANRKYKVSKRQTGEKGGP